MLDILFRIIIGVILFIIAVIDLYKKEIPVWLLMILGMAAVMGEFVIGMNIFSHMLGISIGIALLGISFITREKIGYGDGIIVCILGVYLKSGQITWMLFLAGIIMTVVSIYILLSKKGKKDYELAFVPAMFLGYLFV